MVAFLQFASRRCAVRKKRKRAAFFAHVGSPAAMAALSVEDLLARAEEREAETQRSVTVHKELDVEFDVGNLMAVDKNPAPRAVARQGAVSQREALLRALARDNTQLLVGQLWALPSERAEGGAGPVVARLPEPSTRMPREKPLPKPRPLTRWEQFARLKGIRPTRKKRGTLVWDEAAKEWRRRWGYRRGGGDPSQDWLLEVPDSADPLEDQFAKRRQEKRERVARNEFNRLRNLGRAHRGGTPTELHPTGHQDRAELGRVTALARISTASRGRFQPRLPKEPHAPQSATAGGKKRRFGPVLGDLEGEKNWQLELARNLGSKKPPLDLTRAVNKQLREEEAEAASAKGKKRGQRGKRGRRQQQRPGGAKGKKSGGAARRGNRGRPGSIGGKGKRK
ncbi:ribosome biogenesis regulatory protein homolog isoform X2 [Rhineura floridana]|uniref:ribosome biogenesis regulatory protein homolog isoform X2 n=1 Tax=Rhineura floridana TaxID=261503 RepID=UPI002AC7EB26|nr:ribosome biogenesis regulatory protein homolog isoform X2 [Rhineura floridana]